MIRRTILLITFFIISSGIALAQTGTVEGKVTNMQGEPLIGATVVIQGTKLGANTDSEGNFSISNVPAGNNKVRCSYVGYEKKTIEVNVNANQTTSVEFSLLSISIQSRSISVVASRAKFRETPVAFSDVPKEEIALQLGSRDLPMILNQTPGVYATEQGGGAGDARINIRGFDQRNVAVMINGVPVNDMENGWVYWSNWDGLGDVTSSIQVQRGLGAGKIANPYVGGTMNIITDPAEQRPGLMFKNEIGNASFNKTTIVANTGKIGNFAASAAFVRKKGNGLADKLWTDAWAYYLGLRYNASQKHQFEFYLIGAPQMHGQRSYKQPIATFDHELAEDAGVPDDQIKSTPERGIGFNPNWGYINSGTQTDDFYWGTRNLRRSDGYLMERENYYHKPQMNLNWHWMFDETMSLTNVFYLSIGRGGGSGPYGYFPDGVDQYTSDGQLNYQGLHDYNSSDAAIDEEYSTTDRRSASILRNSVNHHFWIGYLGTLTKDITDEITFQGGLDLRYYEGAHWREVRNLLGGDYYINTSDNTIDYGANPEAAMKGLGDKIAYHNDGLVNWIGGFAQTEYKNDKTTGYLNVSLSQTGMKRIDYFRTEDMPNGRETDWENMIGYTFKGGANYNLTETLNIFANAGYYSRAPNFRNVYYYDNSKLENITNEKVMAFEVGTGYRADMFYANLDFYYTIWNDRAWYTSSYTTDPDGNRTYYNYNLSGLDAVHMGGELSFGLQPHDMLKFYGMASLGDWTWANDVEARFSPEEDPTQEFVTNVYAKDLKVGDAAQKTFALGMNLYPFEDFYFNINYKYFWDHFSNFDPARRTEPEDTEQAWEIPAYGLLDAHMNYRLPFEFSGAKFELFGHVFNLLDSKYITDADDGSDHNAATADVFVGLPIRFNIGVIIRFEPPNK